jgi:hypothetical protein
MSVISALTATPNRIEILCRLMSGPGEGGMERGDVQAMLSPSALRRQGNTDSGGMAQEVVSEALRLGLIESVAQEDKSALLRFVPPAEPAEQEIRTRLERLLLNPDRAAEAGQRGFPLAMAWFLAQDPARPLRFSENIRQEILDQCGGEDDFGLTNLSRAEQFAYWARFLGYAWHMGVPDRPDAVVPDPTEALTRLLPQLLAGHGDVPLQAVMDAWRTACPVLEGGTARQELEERLIAERQRPADRLSRSTSLALTRIERRGLIRMQRLADAPALLLGSWQAVRPVSHISLASEARR